MHLGTHTHVEPSGRGIEMGIVAAIALSTLQLRDQVAIRQTACEDNIILLGSEAKAEAEGRPA